VRRPVDAGGKVLIEIRQRTRHGRAGWSARMVPVCAGIVCLMWMIPIIGELIDSFRTREAQQRGGWWTAIANPLDVTQWTLTNYVDTLFTTSEDGVNMGQAFINSLLVTVPASVLPILVAAFAAYAFTFMRWWGRDVLFLVVVSLLTVPNQVALLPLLRLYDAVGINGTFLGVWLVHMGFGLPLAILILRTHMRHIPSTLIESARIDGASHFTTFWRLVVPMSIPAYVSFAVVQFLWVWNDLLLALVFLGRGDNAPATLALQGLHGQDIKATELIPAAAFVAITIPVVVLLCLQRYVIPGMFQTTGAARKPVDDPARV
jgi:alpha-glucoside transport system permease protein